MRSPVLALTALTALAGRTATGEVRSWLPDADGNFDCRRPLPKTADPVTRTAWKQFCTLPPV